MSSFSWHIDALITGRLCYFKRDRAWECGTEYHVLVVNFSHDKVYIFRMVCYLDSSIYTKRLQIRRLGIFFLKEI